MAVDMNLSGIRSASELMRRVGGEDILALLSRLGFWVGGDNPLDGERRRFPTDVSKLSSDRLGDENAYWQSELSRVIAIHGALQSQRMVAGLDLKRVRTSAAARLLADAKTAGERPPTRDQLNIAIDERPEVRAPEDKLLILDVVMASLGAVKEAYEGYCRVLSREVTRRGDIARIHR
jgi:hypothetical protein